MLPQWHPSSMLLGLLAIFVLLYAIFTAWSRRYQPKHYSNAASVHEKSCHSIHEKDYYHDIDPLDDFDWSSTPVPWNPVFKPKYHLTMGLETIPMSELIAMDRTYAERMQVRRSIMDENPDATIRCNPVADTAVFELYDWIFFVYLPRRFPSVYRLISDESKGDTTALPHVMNLVTSETISLRPSSSHAALRTIGAHIDTDFAILLPSTSQTASDGAQQPLHHLEAYVVTFPSGFDLRSRLGLPLTGIHGPVPGYKVRLERSMDKTFARLEPGKLFKRSNWSVTTNGKLFSLGENHLHVGEHHDRATHEASSLTPSIPAKSHSRKNGSTHAKTNSAPPSAASSTDSPTSALEVEIARQKQALRISDCCVRSERQTLFRLPASRAVVFSFKTYLFRLDAVKAAGHAADLADAIEGLGTGNVPEMNVYKRGVVWGDAVAAFLRS